MDFEVWPEAIELGRLFAEQGYELALVGGPVRDLLLHRKSHDLDFCSSARPEQFEPILRRWGHDGFWDMGRKFGTLGAMRRRPDELPWQRVIREDGTIAGGEYAPLRRAMLEAEGVPFTQDGRVAIDRCRWQPGEAGLV